MLDRSARPRDFAGTAELLQLKSSTASRALARPTQSMDDIGRFGIALALSDLEPHGIY
jgi:hypothetical protein